MPVNRVPSRRNNGDAGRSTPKQDNFSQTLKQAAPAPTAQAKPKVLDTTVRDSFSAKGLQWDDKVGFGNTKVEVGAKSSQRIKGWGAKPEDALSTEVSAGINIPIAAGGASATYRSEMGAGTITTGDMNSNVLTRAWNGANEMWDRSGGAFFKGFDLGHQSGAKLDSFSGVKAKLSAKGPEVTVAAGELNAKVEVGPKATIRTTAGDVKAGAGLDAKVAGGVGVSAGSTTRQTAVGPIPVYGKVGTVNVTAAEVKFQPKIPTATPDFSDMRAGGHSGNTALARGIQTNFAVSNGGQVSVRIPDNLKVFEGPANGRDATVANAFGTGKTAGQRNALDDLMAGRYVRVQDAGRWIRNIGQQNAANPKFAALTKVSDANLVALNKDKVITLNMNGVPTEVISQQNISTGLYFDQKNNLQMADQVKVNGQTVNLR